MNAARRLAMIVGFFTWLFCWSLLRDARAIFNGGVLGPIPPWLMGILGVALLLTISTAITAAIRLSIWTWCALASAVFVLAGVLGAHYAKLSAASDALARLGHTLAGGSGLAAVVRDALRSGPLHVAFFIGAPLVLAAAGAYGWLRGPRTLFAEEAPDVG